MSAIHSNKTMSFINTKRLRDYPRLLLIVTWFIMGLNLLLHQGWIGAFSQVIGGDFIVFYSTGTIYRTNPGLIYDYETQSLTQQSLVAPTVLPGFNPYINPPFVAQICSLLTFIPLNWALILWTILAITSVFISVLMIYRLVPSNDLLAGLSTKQLAIIALSFFPFIEGLQAGQNHWLTLLLVTAIIFAMVREKWYVAGLLGALLIYKPQFAVGFLILWLIWKKYKALLSFALVALGWVGIFTISNGLDLFRTYLQLNQVFMSLPYMPGFPNYLLITVYGLLTSFLPQNTQGVLSVVSQILFVVCGIMVGWLAFKLRDRPMIEKAPAIAAAIVFPLLASPYALLHDMVILIPAFVLWSYYSASNELLYSAIITYLGAFLLTFIAALTKVAWVSLLTISLFIGIFVWMAPKHRTNAEAVFK